MTVTVTGSPGTKQYEARVDGALAGYAEHIRTPGMIAFIHTKAYDAYEGQGIGSALARPAQISGSTLLTRGRFDQTDTGRLTAHRHTAVTSTSTRSLRL